MTQSADNPLSVDVVAPSAADAAHTGATNGRKTLFRIVKWLTILVVIAAMAWQLSKLVDDWSTDGARILEKGVLWPWVFAALGFFWMGQFCFALYWRRLVRTTGATAPYLSTIRAYLVGTLGKYVPGKALVVVVRTGMLPEAKGRRFLIGGTTVYETLTSMAAAGLLGLIALASTRSDLVMNMTGAAAIAIALNVIVHPVPFGHLAKLVAIPFRRKGDPLPASDWYRCYWKSMPLLVCEWLGSGLSLWATAAAFQLPNVYSVEAAVFMTGVAALATAAGFLVLPVPAGVGVREFVIISLMVKWTGDQTAAVCVSLILRTIWTTGEILLAGGLYMLPGVTWARAKLADSNASR